MVQTSFQKHLKDVKIKVDCMLDIRLRGLLYVLSWSFMLPLH